MLSADAICGHILLKSGVAARKQPNQSITSEITSDKTQFELYRVKRVCDTMLKFLSGQVKQFNS